MPALKRILIGKPISSEEEAHQRIRKLVALPVFASDAISSTAYATDEILVVLLLQAGIGATAFNLLTPIAVVVCVLLVIVVMSYRQTIHAYPSGGGAYIVSRENLGETPSLVAGASLLVDYILTVAVSVAGGVLAIRTAFGFSNSWTVPICLACIVLMTVVNLRGVKESGAAFAGPTYFYVIMLLILLGTGFYRVFVQHVPPIPESMLSDEAIIASKLHNSLSLYMLARAFSSGAVALSGVEAVSNGVPAFRVPESRNAAHTLVWMGVILGSCFLGVSVLASHLKPYRGEHDGNGLGLMAEYVFNGKGVLFWMLMIGTFMILILAANTAYADFPRLASIIARDGFLPRQFFNRGARLVFSNGVIFLASVASVLIIAFNGNISKLIPLYAFGVFTGFTLSQAGMVRHHLKEQRTELASQHGHQCNRGSVNRADRDHRGCLQVRRRSLDSGGSDPDHGVHLPIDRQALQEEPRSGCRSAGLPGATRNAHHGRAGRRRQQGGAAWGAVRPIIESRPHSRRHRGQQRRRTEGHRRPVEGLRSADRTAHGLLAVS